MSTMNDRVFQLLTTDIFLKITVACLNQPKKANQIAEELNFPLVNVGQWLARLEDEGVIAYSESGWKTTGEAAAIIRKYFT